MTPITKILIANRGEIAVRIARTCRKLGIHTVAVFSDADAEALHVEACDEAVYIGASTPAESYLNIEKIISVAQSTKSQAVHPGYGFLSENAAFADALEEAGIIFIGPTADTIRAMGSKSSAKDLMEAAGVPTTPGYQGSDQSLKTFQQAAQKIGYPILLKASAGGGGKGMRIVERQGDLKSALAAARQEARTAFGDDRFLIEKYIPRARHVEVQVFGDGRGEVVHLFERDCSVQRRHQKIIEEAPAPDLPSEVRDTLLAAGVSAAKAVNYRGAGTVEFLYDGHKNVFFMEMNTRLQVEHPISEMITGVDLVEWQILIASGQPLPKTQEQIVARGHAFEARVYAEKPSADFAPSVGCLQTVKLPNEFARVDTGVKAGHAISPHYDPMISKIIVHASSRNTALQKLRTALKETAITGVETNTSFLTALTRHDHFARGDVSTRFIEEHSDALFAPVETERFAVCVFSLFQHRSEVPQMSSFRLNSKPSSSFWGTLSGKPQLFELTHLGPEYLLRRTENAAASDRRKGKQSTALESIKFSGKINDRGWFEVTIDGVRRVGFAFPHAQSLRVFIDGTSADIGWHDPRLGDGAAHDSAGSLKAPMPGIIVALFVEQGDRIEKGQPLASMEAMKMEHSITAPESGIVKAVKYSVGEQVKDGDLLFDITPDN